MGSKKKATEMAFNHVLLSLCLCIPLQLSGLVDFKQIDIDRFKQRMALHSTVSLYRVFKSLHFYSSSGTDRVFLLISPEKE